MVILSHGFRQNIAEKCSYSKFTDCYGVIIHIYVDDLLIFGINMEGISKMKKYYTLKFKMKDLNKVDTILDIKVKKYNGGYALCQFHYVEKKLLKFHNLVIKEENSL